MNEEYIEGFIEGFMSTFEGYNGEYGGLGNYDWNVPNKEEKEELKIKLKEYLENRKE